MWFYVLKEAEIAAHGLHLGPVGGRIAAEVLIGLLQADPDSYLATQPRWRPTLPAKTETFRMTDFLTLPESTRNRAANSRRPSPHAAGGEPRSKAFRSADRRYTGDHRRERTDRAPLRH
jgi:hypothetical protein